MDFQQLKAAFDVNDVVGKPIEIDKYTTVIPVSKVSYGFVGGDADIKTTKNSDKNAVNAGGYGMTVSPLGILIVGEKNTYIRIDRDYTEDKWINLLKSIAETIKK
ncbi:MAG: GerW family sporulation protein [Eubacteriales bacterium]|nr:GerW family sporulation protein [Christensenellaceae bacterium]MDY3241462.1 GerW family sporulation protein [Eubacteriales bacterium]